MCVLFNIGAQQSGAAAVQALDTEDSLKQAAKLLQVSPVTVQHGIQL